MFSSYYHDYYMSHIKLFTKIRLINIYWLNVILMHKYNLIDILIFSELDSIENFNYAINQLLKNNI